MGYQNKHYALGGFSRKAPHSRWIFIRRDRQWNASLFNWRFLLVFRVGWTETYLGWNWPQSRLDVGPFLRIDAGVFGRRVVHEVHPEGVPQDTQSTEKVEHRRPASKSLGNAQNTRYWHTYNCSEERPWKKGKQKIRVGSRYLHITVQYVKSNKNNDRRSKAFRLVLCFFLGAWFFVLRHCKVCWKLWGKAKAISTRRMALIDP